MSPKRIVILPLCILVAAAIGFAGAQSEESGASGDAGFNATGLPIVDAPVTLSAVVLKNQLHGPYAEMPVFQQLEEETGVRIDWIEFSNNGFDEQKNLLLASGDLPDIFMHGITDNDQLTYGSQGVLVPLEEMIDSYAPNIAAVFDQRPEIRQFVTTPDKHIYVIPRVQELSHRETPDNAYINQTWLDALGLEMPTTTDEFYDVLYEFRNGDPNGNGKRDELPFSFQYPAWSGVSIYSFFGAFGRLDRPTSHVVVENGRVVYSPHESEYRDALVWFNELYEDELIDPEVFTHDGAQYTAKGSEDDMLYGVFVTWFDENTVGVERAENDYTYLLPLEGPGGDRLWNRYPESTLARTNFAVTSANAHPEVSIRYADQLYTEYRSYQLCWGEWGVNIERDGDRVVFLDPPEGMGQDEFRYKYSPAFTTPFYLDAENFKEMELSSNHVRKIERRDAYEPSFPPLSDIYPKVYFTAEEEEELSVLRADLNNYVHQMTASFIVGEVDVTVDSNWDDFVSRLESMGLDRYIEIHQVALDRFL